MQLNKDKKNFSFHFLLPVTLINPNVLLKHGIVNSFLKDSYRYPEEELGTFIYLLFSTPEFEPFKSYYEPHGYIYEKFASSGQVFNIYEVSDEHTMMRFSIKKEYQDTVVTPFLKGQYSKINREYVDSFFPSVVAELVTLNDGITQEWEYKENKTYLILTKARELREKLEDDLGVSIPSTAELGSIPNPDLETFKLNINELV